MHAYSIPTGPDGDRVALGKMLDPKQIPSFEVIKGRVQSVAEKQAATAVTPKTTGKKPVKKVKAAVKVGVRRKRSS